MTVSQSEDIRGLLQARSSFNQLKGLLYTSLMGRELLSCYSTGMDVNSVYASAS